MTLRVILQIVPHGDESKTYEIGRLDIFNKGPLTSPEGWDRGGYHQYGVLDLTPKEAGMYECDISHRRWEGAWQLVKKAIDILEIKGP